MRTSTCMLAAALAAVLGTGQAARAQFAVMAGKSGPYPDMMAPSTMYPGQGFPGPSPYAPPAFAPAAYAGMGGPAPMGPMPPSPAMQGMQGMAMQGMAPGMPPGPGYGDGGYGGYGDYCDDGGGWTNLYFAFGEFLYLGPPNAEVAYAVPINRAFITG